MRTGETFKPAAAEPAPLQEVQNWEWKSPMPYLFGGLAAMLGLVAFSLLIMACSYWKLSEYFDSIEAAAEGESGDAGGGSAGAAANDTHKGQEDDEKPLAEVPERCILVIMAGEGNPTYMAMATPAWSCGSSFDAGSSSSGGSCNGEKAVVLSERGKPHPRDEGEGGEVEGESEASHD
ncbi:hypothetical protein Dimus_002446 [Dionaea muscipula]